MNELKREDFSKVTLKYSRRSLSQFSSDLLSEVISFNHHRMYQQSTNKCGDGTIDKSRADTRFLSLPLSLPFSLPFQTCSFNSNPETCLLQNQTGPKWFKNLVQHRPKCATYGLGTWGEEKSTDSLRHQLRTVSLPPQLVLIFLL